MRRTITATYIVLIFGSYTLNFSHRGGRTRSFGLGEISSPSLPKKFAYGVAMAIPIRVDLFQLIALEVG